MRHHSQSPEIPGGRRGAVPEGPRIPAKNPPYRRIPRHSVCEGHEGGLILPAEKAGISGKESVPISMIERGETHRKTRRRVRDSHRMCLWE